MASEAFRVADGLPENIRELLERIDIRIKRAEQQIAQAQHQIDRNLIRIDEKMKAINEEFRNPANLRDPFLIIGEGIVRGASAGESSIFEGLESAAQLAEKEIMRLESMNLELREGIDRRRMTIKDLMEDRERIEGFFQ